MNALPLAIVAFLAMAGAAACGSLVARRLPESFLGEPSIESLKAAMALVATMTALILGLMVNSARYQYSDAEKDVHMYATTLMRMDIELTNFGGPACELRGPLRDFITHLLAQTWPKTDDTPVLTDARPATALLLDLTRKLSHLTPQNDVRETLLSLGHQLLEYRWRISDYTSDRTPNTFIIAVIFWLALIYGNLGVFAPRTPLVLCGFLAAMVCIASAIFLVIEMNGPFTGQLRVPRAPFTEVLAFMGSEPCGTQAGASAAPAGPGQN
ncbi:DUF4239 domain-containing protein [Aquabacter sediminis]|uniref:bestrophin-like domain n=1 Tax=Aquabacter sediminis TaxID=3029197 RepID=UPI00237DE453|nr:DUF4239 domain-containing protein [Aquabacter sp. P-9]MDE1568773.1 DUF4239 domain-containing protein [Aquabacter sp. P-9]